MNSGPLSIRRWGGLDIARGFPQSQRSDPPLCVACRHEWSDSRGCIHREFLAPSVCDLSLAGRTESQSPTHVAGTQLSAAFGGRRRVENAFACATAPAPMVPSQLPDSTAELLLLSVGLRHGPPLGIAVLTRQTAGTALGTPESILQDPDSSVASRGAQCSDVPGSEVSRRRPRPFTWCKSRDPNALIRG